MHTVEGRTDLVKDPETGAIINIDATAHSSAVAGAKARERAKQQLNNNTIEINSIKEEVSEINIMMKPLLNNNVMGINSIKEEVSEIKLMMKQLLKRFDDDGR